MERDRGQGSPDQKPKSQNNAYLKEQGKPKGESAANNPTGGKKTEKVSLYKPGRAIFECAIPRVIPSPSHIRPMLRHGLLREEQAQEAEQEWRGNLRTWDRQRLEEAICSLQKSREMAASRNKQEAVHDLEYELQSLRAELRQRE